MNSFVRKTLIFIAVMAVIGVSGWAGRKLYKKSTAHRMVSEARQYIQKKDFRNASLCLERALQINPFDAKASDLMADMLDVVGSPAALSWRIRTAQLQTNNVEYRFAWAQTALKAGEPISAAQALQGVDEKWQNTAIYHKLAGGLAWNIHDITNAEYHYSAALRMEPTNEAVILNLAIVQLSSTNKTVADKARQSLQKVPTNSPLHVVALRRLATDAEARKSFNEAIAYSQEVIASPGVAFSDKIAHLQLLRDAKNKESHSWQVAIEDEAKHSPGNVFELAHWMMVQESPEETIRWLRQLPANMQTNLPVPLAITDCQIGLKDWSALAMTVDKQDWGEAEYYRLLLESLAKQKSGQHVAAKNAWQKSLRLSDHRLDRLSSLSRITDSCDMKSEKIEVLQTIVSEFPNQRWAADRLVSIYYADGNTRAIAELLSQMYSTNPSDNRLKNNLATINLLRKSDVETACRLAHEAYESAPDNPFFVSTYAYSLLVQSKFDEAAKTFQNVKAEYLKIPAIAAYYGAVQAKAGNKEAALGSLKLAESASLLPEEKEMIRQARAQL